VANVGSERIGTGILLGLESCIVAIVGLISFFVWFGDPFRRAERVRLTPGDAPPTPPRCGRAVRRMYDACGDRCRISLFNWFDRPLIEAWLERQLATSSLTTSHVDAVVGASGASSKYSTGTT
jgi:hypothetical protein